MFLTFEATLIILFIGKLPMNRMIRMTSKVTKTGQAAS